MARGSAQVKEVVETPVGVVGGLTKAQMAQIVALFKTRKEIQKSPDFWASVAKITGGKVVPAPQVDELVGALEKAGWKKAALAPLRKVLSLSKATYDATVSAGAEILKPLAGKIGKNATHLANSIQELVISGVPLSTAIENVKAEAVKAAKSDATIGADEVKKWQEQMRESTTINSVVWIKPTEGKLAKLSDEQYVAHCMGTIAAFKALGC